MAMPRRVESALPDPGAQTPESAALVPAPAITLDLPRYVRWHAAAIVVLVVLSLAGQTLRLVLHHDRALGFVRDFNLDDERNVPSWFQSVTLMMAAGLLELAGRVRRRVSPSEAGRWRVLAAGFVLMSLDEAASFHERLRLPLALLRNTPGYQAFSWVVPGIAVVALTALAFVPWLNTLPARTRRGLAVAGAVFVGGAVGLEAVGGLEAITVGIGGWLYVWTYTLEETMEMVGVLILIATVLDFLQRQDPPAVLRFAEARPPAA